MEKRDEEKVVTADSLIGKTVRGEEGMVVETQAGLGKGGMGAVCLGEVKGGKLQGQKVAVKFLHAHLGASPKAVKRFQQEALATRQINHPGVVKVLDVGTTADGLHFMVLELLQGEPLEDRLRSEGTLSARAGIRLARLMAAAIAAAHRRGIVHRDLKPDNIYLMEGADGADEVKLIDFGIAKLIEAPEGAEAVDTTVGTTLGTPNYMSLEQMRATLDVDHRADIYSLGAVLYRMFAGHCPFTGGGFAEIYERMLAGPPTPLQNLRGDLPRGLSDLVQRMLSQKPEERPQTMVEVERALEQMAREKLSDRVVYLSGNSGADPHAPTGAAPAVLAKPTPAPARSTERVAPPAPPLGIWRMVRWVASGVYNLIANLLRLALWFLRKLGRVALVVFLFGLLLTALAGIVGVAFWEKIPESTRGRITQTGERLGGQVWQWGLRKLQKLEQALPDEAGDKAPATKPRPPAAPPAATPATPSQLGERGGPTPEKSAPRQRRPRAQPLPRLPQLPPTEGGP